MSSLVILASDLGFLLGRIIQALSAMARRSQAWREQRRMADAAAIMGV